MEQGKDSGCQCFNGAAGVCDGMMCNDLSLLAIFLIVNLKVNKVWEFWVLVESRQGEWLALMEECDVTQLELLGL